MHALAAQIFAIGTLPFTAAAKPHGLLVALVLLSIITLACLWRVHRERQRARRLADTLKSSVLLAQQHSDRLKEVQKVQTAHRHEAMNLSRELGAQRKKHHTAQQMVSALRQQLRDAHKELEAAKHSRPAFSQASPAPAKALQPSREASAAAKTHAVPTVAPDPQGSEHLAALVQARLETQALQEALAEEKAGYSAARVELQKHRRRAEDLRRVEIITRSKHKLVEDKLRTMGRQYYDAISELAALKGEVLVPPPLPATADGRPGIPARPGAAEAQRLLAPQASSALAVQAQAELMALQQAGDHAIKGVAPVVGPAPLADDHALEPTRTIRRRTAPAAAKKPPSPSHQNRGSARRKAQP